MHEFQLPDMTCGHCAGMVSQTLQMTDPECKVQVDMSKRMVTVQSAEDRKTLVEALTEQAHKLCAMAGTWSLRPEHIRLNVAGEIQTEGVVQAVQYQGAATRFELKLAGGEKLLVSQANLTGEMLPSTLSPGQQVMASWSRDVMVPLVEER